MTPFRRNEAGRGIARRIFIILFVISGIIISLFYIQLMPSVTKEKVTKGRIVFSDGAHHPLAGTITISGTGMTGGHQENVSTVTWNEVPNAIIGFNAFDGKGISINLRIDDDSPYGDVMIQDHGSGKPGSIDISAPGEPVKYIEIEANNINFGLANVTFLYTDDEIENIDENNLALYIFDTDAVEWKEVISSIDTNNNTISAIVDAMSVFALGHQENSNIKGKVYYQKYDGSMIDTPSTIKATPLGYRINWLGMNYDLVWDRSMAYDILYYPNGSFVSPWIFPRVEYWRSNSKKWVEVTPVGNSFEQIGNQIIRKMVMSDASRFNITYIVSDKIQYIWNFTAGANQNYSIVFRVDSAASKIDVKNKKYSPGYSDNFMDYSWTDIPEPYAANTSSWYEAGDRKFFQRIILGKREIDTQITINSTWSTKGINAFKSISGDLIEIGTQDSPSKPYLKLNKWDGEVSLKVDIPHGKDGVRTLSQNTLKFASNKSEVEFYPKQAENKTEIIQGKNHTFRLNEEGGVEFDVILKEKPESNVFEFPIHTTGLNFYYQPALHPEHPTWADIDGDGVADTFRPENVVGSYAVYHERRIGDYTALGGRNYRAGKAFHIYRPEVTDAQGKEIFGELNLDEENATLTVAVDQDWLNNAVYPVTIDPNFGYEGAGSSYTSGGNIEGSVFTGAAGTGNSISAYIYYIGDGQSYKFALYNHSDSSLVTDGTTNQGTANSTQWYTQDFSASPTLSATDYVITVRAELNLCPSYDTGIDDQGHSQSVDYGNPWPDPATFAHNTSKYSIYVTYTEAAAGAAPNITSWGNNKTNNATSVFAINSSEAVNFNATSNQTITTWNWVKDDTYQSNNYDNFTTSWSAAGSYHIDVNATNANGTSNMITWNISVFAATYNISGYVTESGGLPLGGVTVQTNTSLNTTTNLSGFYSFTGLFNDTYLINASFAGYDTNSTNVTVSGADTINANISLSPSTVVSDCVSCHNYGANSSAPSDKRINASSIKQGVHKNLNNATTNSSILSDMIDKACWACHGDGLEPAGHPANYSNPWTCVSCHNASATFTSSNATVQHDITRKKTYEHIQYPYNESIDSTVWNSTVTCIFCHNKSMVNFTDSVTATDPLSANVSHYTNTSNLISPSINCALCHKSPANSTEWKANLTRHPANTQDVSYCANCHNSTNATGLHDRPLVGRISVHGGGGGHSYLPQGGGFDWEKDDFNDTGLDEPFESCVACHGSYDLFSCELCHVGNTTPPPKLCESCHLPDTASQFTGPYRNGLYNLRSDINDTMPRVYAHTNYSTITDVTVAAQKGDNRYYPTSCYSYYYYYDYSHESDVIVMTCHGAPYANRSEFGGYYAAMADDDVMQPGNPAHTTKTIDRMPDTTNCLFCHNQSNITVQQGWAGPMQINASNMFGNRYGVNNTSCYACHTRNSTKPDDFHSNEVVKGGGPGCLGCHNNSDPQNFTAVDGTLLAYIDGANYSKSMHANLNSDNASGYGINASCWGCHNSSGTMVANNTHPDKRDTPFVCQDCHLAGGTRAGAYNATIIYNHYKNGTFIRALYNSTNDVASCVGCHENVSGMITGNNDSDTGSFATDGIGAKGGNTSFYHYGANRSHFNIEAGSYDYCIYCHRNLTGEFSIVFEDAANMSISNHSLGYNSTNPSCSAVECHNSTNSTLHRISIRKPDINITLHNTSYCLDCHGINSTGNGTNYTGAITSYKETHNNSVRCTECHTGSNKKNIHPIKYLQSDGSLAPGNQTGINCTDCHQQSTVDSLLLLLPPKIANPMHHSDNTSNGTAWNTIGYWTVGSAITSCIYCHNDSKHNASGLGRSALWKGSNTVNSSIDSGNWCSSCHYRGYSGGANNYIDMTAAFLSANLQVPPEITNGTYAPYNFTRYYNHSLINYSDATCKPCHGSHISSDAGISAFIHNMTLGSCTGCHYSLDAMNSSNRPDRYVDSDMYNASLHGSLTCQNCHTKGHNNIGYRKACEDCHAVQADAINDSDRHNIISNPATNIYNGESVVNITDCTKCHKSILLNNSRNIYGYGKTKDCDYCHTYPDKYYN